MVTHSTTSRRHLAQSHQTLRKEEVNKYRINSRGLQVSAQMSVKNLYENHFDSHGYAFQFTSDESYDYKWIFEDFLHRLFQEGKLRGKTLCDVGSGPLIRSVISASAFIPEIYLSDFLEGNRNLIQKWFEGSSNAPNYSSVFKHVAQLEGQTDHTYLEARIKGTVKDILPCDILAENPLYPLPQQQFDIVTSSLCIDCYPDDKDYLQGMNNLAGLIRPGGHLVLLASLGCTKYCVKDTVFPSAFLDENKISSALFLARLERLEYKEYIYDPPLDYPGCDSKGLATILACKS